MALQAVLSAARRCAGSVLKGAPPEPSEVVKALMKSYRMNATDMLQMYDVFHYLKQLEDPEAVFSSAVSIDVESAKRIVADRRRWVLRILVQLLRLGDCQDTVSWDQFLFIFIRFCSLNRVELAQALFLVIQRELESSDLHYVSERQLAEYYKYYKDCPIKSFCTYGFDFGKLPLTRYYATDFTELVQRFNVLINPMMHLQRTIQAHLPGVDFWDGGHRAEAFCRRISFDFFRMETGRVHLWGEPPFRESCDMLLPDALGAVAVNEDQWMLRTSAHKVGKGLRQVSVWGEQPTPELVERIKIRLAEEAEAARIVAIEAAAAKQAAAVRAHREMLRLAAMKADPEIDDALLDAGEADTAEAATGAALDLAELGGGGLVLEGLPREAWAQEPGKPPGAGADADRSTMIQEMPRLPPPPPPRLSAEEQAKAEAAAQGPQFDPIKLSVLAACLDESDSVPIDLAPPRWMAGATICPAPQVPGWGSRPVPRTVGKSLGGGGDRRRAGSESTSLLAAR